MNTNAPLKELVPVTARGEATRRKLLSSAEIEFGSKGFPAASVSSITQRADVGQGTFYLYFHSKEEVFATLVRTLGAELCKSIEALSTDATAGKDGERRVATLLLEFAAVDIGRHRILSESQFVDAPVFREVHEKLFAAVAKVLAAGARGLASPEALLRAAALVGACASAALQHCQWAGKTVGKPLVDAVIGAA